jgi:hypothetical protein
MVISIISPPAVDGEAGFPRPVDGGFGNFLFMGLVVPLFVPDARIDQALGLEVEIMARVKLNGKDLGILWKPPYQVDLTKAAVKGINHLEISVVNLWVNRLIGDQLLPEDSERNKTGTLVKWPQWVIDGKSSRTGRKSFVTFPLWKKNEPLRKSGLLGPVVLRSTPSQPDRMD